MTQELLENSILGTCINDVASRGSAFSMIYDPQVFTIPRNQIIFANMREMGMKDQVIDSFSLVRHLRNSKDLQSVGGASYVEELAQYNIGVMLVEERCNLMFENFIYKTIKAAGGELITDAEQKIKKPTDLLQRTIASLEAIMYSQTKAEVKTFYQAAKGVEKDYQRQKEDGKEIKGYPMGIPDVDRILGGAEPGEFIVVGARPSQGKSAFMIKWCKHLAMDLNIAVGILSFEASDKEVATRTISNGTHLPAERIKRGFLGQDFDKMSQWVERKKNAPWFIDDDYSSAWLSVKARIITLVRKYGCKVVFIDYLGLIDLLALLMLGYNKNNALGEVSRGLKMLAKSLNIPIIALHQLSREVDSRPNPKPRIADLRDSGAIEQDANKIIFLFRPEVYAKSRGEDAPKDKAGNSLNGKARVIIAKNRDGALGEVWTDFHGPTMTFSNLKADDPLSDGRGFEVEEEQEF